MPQATIDAAGNSRRKTILKSPFGEYLCQLRTQRNLSPTVLARKARLRWSGHIWSIEAGRCHPSKDTVNSIAEALGADPDLMWEERVRSKQLWQDQKRTPAQQERMEGRCTHHATVYLSHDEYLYCNRKALSTGKTMSSTIREMVKDKYDAET